MLINLLGLKGLMSLYDGIGSTCHDQPLDSEERLLCYAPLGPPFAYPFHPDCSLSACIFSLHYPPKQVVWL